MRRIGNRALRFASSLSLALALLSAAARAQSSDDVWQLVYLDEAKVGFIHQSKEPDDSGGKQQTRTLTDSSITINRLGATISVVISAWTLEDASGGIAEMYFESNFSQAKSIDHLVRHGDQATIEKRIGGPTQKRTIEWKSEWLSDSAMERVKRDALTKGEKEFSFSTYTLESGEAAITTHVLGKEKVEVKGVGSQELLHVRVDNSAAPVPTDAWLDEKFDDVMTVTRLMGIPMVTVRSDRAACVAAFAKPDTPEIFNKISPRTNVRLPNPYHTDEVVLRLRATDPNAPMPKLENERQTIISKQDERDVTLRVRRVVPSEKFTLPLANFTAEEKECLEPSPNIQCDDAELVKLAKDAVGDEKDAWTAAQKLEKFVNGYISNKNMDSIFETATGVMKSKSGDCTEHGVLLAGLCRAVRDPRARRGRAALFPRNLGRPHVGRSLARRQVVRARRRAGSGERRRGASAPGGRLAQVRSDRSRVPERRTRHDDEVRPAELPPRRP